MADAIIILIVIVLLGFALKGSIKHFRGEGPCCGGGSGKVTRSREKILDGPVIARKTIRISGMHCENCVNSITAALNKWRVCRRRSAWRIRRPWSLWTGKWRNISFEERWKKRGLR